MKPGCSAPPHSTNSSTWPTFTAGGWCWSATPASCRQRLDALEAEARTSTTSPIRHPAATAAGTDREQLDRIEPLLDAVDIWRTWAHGRPVPTADLATAVSTSTDAACRAPLLAVNDGEIDRTAWFDALQPVTDLLRMHGIQLSSGRDLELERGREASASTCNSLGHGGPLDNAGSSTGGGTRERRIGTPVRGRAAERYGRLRGRPRPAQTGGLRNDWPPAS